MAYHNIGTAEIGTYSSWICPSPNSPITRGWGSAIALGVARLVSSGYATLSFQDAGISVHSATVYMHCQRVFQKCPIVKIWVNGQPDGTYSDYEYVGGEMKLEENYTNDFSGVRIGAIGVNANNERGFLLDFGDDRGLPWQNRLGTIVVLVQGR